MGLYLLRNVVVIKSTCVTTFFWKASSGGSSEKVPSMWWMVVGLLFFVGFSGSDHLAHLLGPANIFGTHVMWAFVALIFVVVILSWLLCLCYESVDSSDSSGGE